VFPGGKTFLHILADYPDLINGILSRTLLNEGYGGDATALKYVFPYVQDMTGECPIGYYLRTHNEKSANHLLRYFKSTPIDHHSKFLAPYLPKLLELDLPNFKEYLYSLSK
jgi:hypothetical protein